METLVTRYNERDENDVLRSEVYEEMAEQLTNLIWEVHQEFTAGDDLGIDFEEKAFYDILKELCVKYDFSYPEDKLIQLAKAVKDLVADLSKFPDWNNKDSIKSELKVGLILLLDENGYPPVERDEVYKEMDDRIEYPLQRFVVEPVGGVHGSTSFADSALLASPPGSPVKQR